MTGPSNVLLSRRYAIALKQWGAGMGITIQARATGPLFALAVTLSSSVYGQSGPPPEPDIDGARERFEAWLRYNPLETQEPDQPLGSDRSPLSVFTDCDGCPEMVVIPGGTFTMGSPDTEEGRDSDEGPQRIVRVGRFAMGRYEVTSAQWDACAADGYCRGVGLRGTHPAIFVSWNDITGEAVSERGFLAWMNAKVDGTPYRLPTEAEWEYAARAGTTTRFWWGDEDPVCTAGARNGANFRACTDDQTRPVGRSRANPFGLFDVHGNVWEWTADCWNASYDGAPTDGAAWRGGDCDSAPVRGGSWLNFPLNLRSANRYWVLRDYRYYYVGFRLARTL